MVLLHWTHVAEQVEQQVAELVEQHVASASVKALEQTQTERHTDRPADKIGDKPVAILVYALLYYINAAGNNNNFLH